MITDQAVHIIYLRNGDARLAGSLTDTERNQVMLDAASRDSATMRLHLNCNVKCPINAGVLAERTRLF